MIGAWGPRGRAERVYSVRPFLTLSASDVSWVVKDINESRLWSASAAHDFCQTVVSFNSNSAVPQTPVRFRLPAACDFCQARGTLVPGTTVQGSTVVLTWVCRECGQDRPITRGEEKAVPRSGPPKRSRQTRKEGRRPRSILGET